MNDSPYLDWLIEQVNKIIREKEEAVIRAAEFGTRRLAKLQALMEERIAARGDLR